MFSGHLSFNIFKLQEDMLYFWIIAQTPKTKQRKPPRRSHTDTSVQKMKGFQRKSASPRKHYRIITGGFIYFVNSQNTSHQSWGFYCFCPSTILAGSYHTNKSVYRCQQNKSTSALRGKVSHFSATSVIKHNRKHLDKFLGLSGPKITTRVKPMNKHSNVVFQRFSELRIWHHL